MTAPVYTRAGTLDEAFHILESAGEDVTVLAGGQDVVPLMHQGRLRPSLLVDISRVPGLNAVADNGIIAMGALVTHARLERHPVIRARIPLFADVCAQIGGGVQVRNRGTIGGAVCAANPAYDLPPCLVAADAQILLRSRRGQRRVPAAGFFLGTARTALVAGELLVGIEAPAPTGGSGAAYEKLKFTDGGYTIASAACMVALAPDGTCREARLAVGGVTEAPIRLHDVERVLKGQHLTSEALTAAGAMAAAAIDDPIGDVMAEGRYRRAMAGVMVGRALGRAAQLARGGIGDR